VPPAFPAGRHGRCWGLSESAAPDPLRAPGTQGTSGPGLTALGWLYIDTGRWDEALEAAAEAAGLAEANQMEFVAAAADLIAATVHALRGDSTVARRHADRALATADPAESGFVAARARGILADPGKAAPPASESGRLPSRGHSWRRFHWLVPGRERLRMIWPAAASAASTAITAQ
jgi:hypothetical protein